ncbi:hypothetical protein V8G54_025034 [Vigna mungo]|uniref:Uncharacterized protein n=1 Tax=Vigna mungo TaxID=3915 RepID=A0AAQ3N8P7_VIGMU
MRVRTLTSIPPSFNPISHFFFFSRVLPVFLSWLVQRPSPSASVTVSHRVGDWLCPNRVSVIRCEAITIGVHPSQRVVDRGLEGCSWRGLVGVWFVRVSELL